MLELDPGSSAVLYWESRHYGIHLIGEIPQGSFFTTDWSQRFSSERLHRKDRPNEMRIVVNCFSSANTGGQPDQVIQLFYPEEFVHVDLDEQQFIISCNGLTSPLLNPDLYLRITG